MNILSKLSSLLKDNARDNSWSSTRFSLLFTVLISNISIFGIWVFVCIVKKEIISIPADIITLYSLANGITMSGKVIQTRHELKYSNQSSSDSQPDDIEQTPKVSETDNSLEEK